MKQYKFSVEEIKCLIKGTVILVDSREKKIAYQVEKMEYGNYSFMIPASAADEDMFFHRDIVVEREASLEELSGNLTGERERFEKSS